MKTEVFILPSHWACALVNGDFSGLEDNEAEDLEAWQSEASAAGFGFCVDVSAESFFCTGNDARAFVLPCDCLEFTFEVMQ
jgi:hypothetical protein